VPYTHASRVNSRYIHRNISFIVKKSAFTREHKWWKRNFRDIKLGTDVKLIGLRRGFWKNRMSTGGCIRPKTVDALECLEII